MPRILSPEQLHEIRRIIAKRHSAVILRVLGPDALTPEERATLEQAGIPTTNHIDAIRESYLYGQVMGKKAQAASMSYEEFKEEVEQNPIPLSQPEEYAVKAAEVHAGAHIRHLGAKIEQQASSLVFEEDAKLRSEMLREIVPEIKENIQKRESIGELKSALGHLREDWSRDWNRVAITEKTNALMRGTADAIQKQDGDAWVYKLPMPDACKHCVRLHIGRDGHPRIFKLAELEANGTNVGVKAAEWKAVVGTVHPHCQCQLIRVPEGWGFSADGDLVPGGTFGIRSEMKKSFNTPSEVYAGESRMGNANISQSGTGFALVLGMPMNHAGAQERPATIKKLKQHLIDFHGDGTERLVLAVHPEEYNVHAGQPEDGVHPLDHTDLQEQIQESVKKDIPKNKRHVLDLIASRLVSNPNLVIKSAPSGQGPMAGHKYVKREWMQDHWVYTYAEKLGGKVVGHEIHEDHVVLKLPKAKMAALKTFKKDHGLKFEVVEGAKYAMLPITKEEAEKIKITIPAAVPKPLPPPVVSKQAQTAPMATLKATDLNPITVPNHILQRGQAVTVKMKEGIIEGTIVGYDGSDNAVFLDKSGERRLAPWKHIRPNGHKQLQVNSYDKLPEGSIKKASPEHAQFVNNALSETMIPNGQPTRAYLDWLHAKGVEAYIVGGFCRDLIAGVANGESPENIQAKLKDHDIVAAAGVHTGKAMFKALGHGQMDGWDTAGVVIAFGPGKTDGVDFASMSHSGFFDWDPRPHKDSVVATPHVTWDQDLEADTRRRDFSVNSVYYDVRNEAFLDPSGRGIEDAKNKFLHVISGKEELAKNNNIAIRFWKFRVRGFTSDAANTKLMINSFEKHAKHFHKSQKGKSRLAKELAKAAGKGSTDRQAFLQNLRSVMEKDGAGKLYDKFIKPLEGKILTVVLD